MLTTTKTALAAILKADSTVTAEQRERAIDLLDGRDEPANTNTNGGDRAITRREAAAMLACDEHTVSRYGTRGLIRRLTFGRGGRRASRYSLQSVQALISGKPDGANE